MFLQHILPYITSLALMYAQLVQPSPGTTNVVILGGYGNLAQKYLWQSLFDLYTSNELPQDVNLYGASRADYDTGYERIMDIISTKVVCNPDVVEEALCQDTLAKFKSIIDYTQMKTEEQYETFMTSLREKEAGTLWYFSISPSYYEQTASWIAAGSEAASKAVPRKNEPWRRVVVEKPFGKDTESAKELIAELSKYLSDEEMLRVDHYLGKRPIMDFAKFRLLASKSNPEYAKMWNSRYISNVEIVMTEALTCEGRTDFYNEYGIIRDVLQNHLTEVFSLASMSIQDDDERSECDGVDCLSPLNRQDVLALVVPPTPYDAVLGQYESYKQHVVDDGGEPGSTVPTFASVNLIVNSKQWKDTKFTLISAKAVDTREAYTKVYFKNGATLLFNFQGGLYDQPVIEVKGDLPAISLPKWVLDDDYSSTRDGLKVYVSKEGREAPAYEVVMKSAVQGNNKMFVNTKELLQLWGIWTPLLHDVAGVEPIIYPVGSNVKDIHAMHTRASSSSYQGGEL